MCHLLPIPPPPFLFDTLKSNSTKEHKILCFKYYPTIILISFWLMNGIRPMEENGFKTKLEKNIIEILVINNMIMIPPNYKTNNLFRGLVSCLHHT